MKPLGLEEDAWIEESAIKNLRNLFRLKKEIDQNIIKEGIRNLFRLHKEMKQQKTE